MQAKTIKKTDNRFPESNTQSCFRKPDRKISDRRYMRLRSLEKGKIKNIGIIENIRLKLAGNSDGARGFPRCSEGNKWQSAFIDKEVNAYEEYCSRIWGSLQIEAESDYKRIGELIDSINHLWIELEKAKENLSNQSNHNEFLSVRKKGEDRLTESQVKARRAREQNKRLAPARNKIAELESKIVAQTEELIELKNAVDEASNTNRMICNRLKDHTFQRIDIYWNYALRKHPDALIMPTVPYVDLSYDAERVFITPHLELMQRADKLMQLISENNKEE